MTNQNILIIGATSGIAQAVARRYAQQGVRMCLLARSADKLAITAADLTARGAARVHTIVWDADETLSITSALDGAWQVFGNFDVALIAHGTLPDQLRTQSDLDYALAQLRINGVSAIACMAVLAQRMEPQGQGVIAVIGSVAGDRGRGSNYTYGAAKAAVDIYAAGLRHRLYACGIHVLTIKPGFVATPMTAGLDLPAKLTVTPEVVAADIQRAIERRKNVLYTPWFWAVIMLIIRWVPSAVFHRSKL
jgi:short-subunit dehydrogenase